MKKKMMLKEEHGKNVEIIFSDIMYLTSQPHKNTTNFCIPVIFHVLSTLISLKVFKLKVKICLCTCIWFSMGIDHSNPYIYSTTY